MIDSERDESQIQGEMMDPVMEDLRKAADSIGLRDGIMKSHDADIYHSNCIM
jgi:hypothetical protein